MEYSKAFLIGGGICALVQILMEKTKLMPGRIMVLLVCLGASFPFWAFMIPLWNLPVPGHQSASWVWTRSDERSKGSHR